MKISWKAYAIGAIALIALVVVLTSKPVKNRSGEVTKESNENSGTISRSTASENNNPKENNVPVIAPSTALALGAGSPKDLDGFLKALDPNGERYISRSDDGRVIQISRIAIKGHADTPDKVYEFAKSIAEYVGTPADQMVTSPTVLEDTPNSKGQQFDQEFEGYQVFGGYMKVFTNSKDNSIYFVANETKNVGDVDLRIKYSFEEAKAIALGKYANKDGERVLNQAQRPVIYNIRPGSSELAWEVEVHIQGPLYDRRHMLISASTGMILKDITMLKN